MKRLVVKGSIHRSARWQPDLIPKLQSLVLKVHTLVTHTYLFARFIFVHELQQDDLSFSLEDHVQKRFFEEVFLSLTTRTSRLKAKTSPQILTWQQLIHAHLPRYLSISGYQKLELKCGQQIAKYESSKIETAYLNNIQERFGTHFRSLVNSILEVKPRIKLLKEKLKNDGGEQDPKFIKAEIKRLITKPATMLKQQLARGRYIHDTNHQSQHHQVHEIFRSIWDAYPSDYLTNGFLKSSIYYDVKANPSKHLNAFYRLAFIQQVLGYPTFQVFPLRTSLIPCYMQIDTNILGKHILDGASYANLEKGQGLEAKMDLIWSQVVDLKQPLFKRQTSNNQATALQFQGTIFTDGVGISVLKQDQASKFGGGKRKRKFKGSRENEDEDASLYIHGQPQAYIQANLSKFVYADPNQRDLLYCQGDGSTADNPQTYRYTRNQRQVEMKANKYKKIRKEIMTSYSEHHFQGPSGSTQLESLQSSLNQLNRKSIDLSTYLEYLQGRQVPLSYLLPFYERHLIFRKLKLGSFILQQQADQRLVRQLRHKFGRECILILGDWSSRGGSNHKKYHEPIRNVGLRNSLVKLGVEVWYIDEHKTSKICPGDSCHDSTLSTFKKVTNPRPYQRKKRPFVTCHGLLQCTAQACRVNNNSNKTRLWNRDIVATSNFKKIVHSLADTYTIPLVFQRSKQADDEAQDQEQDEEQEKIEPIRKRKRHDLFYN